MKRWRKAIPPGIILAGAALRLPWLGRTFPFYDDYYQMYTSLHSRGLLEFLRVLRLNPHHLLLDSLTTFVFARFGDSLAWLSLPSGIAGVAAIALCLHFAAGAGRRRAWLAALLLALSPLHAQWSRGVDFYALLTLLSLLQSILFCLVRREPKRWPWYALGAALFLHAHPYAVLFLPLHLACAFWLDHSRSRKLLWSLARAWTAAAVAFVPWFLWSASTLASTNHFYRGQWDPLTSIPLSDFLARIPLFLAFAPEVGPHRFWEAGPASLLALIIAAAYLCSLLCALRGAAKPELRYAHALVIYGTVSVVILDRLYGYFYSHRQLLWILPFYSLGAADGFCIVLKLVARPMRWTLALAAALIAAALPIHAGALGFQLRMMRTENLIVGEILRGLHPGDTLVVQRADTMMDLLYFLDRSAFERTDAELGADGRMFVGVHQPVEISSNGSRALVVVGDELASGGTVPSWDIRGGLYDMTVVPPLRETPRR